MNEHPAEAKHRTVPTTTITSILYRSCVTAWRTTVLLIPRQYAVIIPVGHASLVAIT